MQRPSLLLLLVSVVLSRPTLAEERSNPSAPFAVLKAKQGNIDSAHFSPNCKYVVVAGGIYHPKQERHAIELKLWNVGTKTLRASLKGQTDFISAVAFSPDSRTLASASMDGTVKLWDVEKGQLRHTLVGHFGWISTVVFSPNGKFILSAGGRAVVNDGFDPIVDLGDLRLWEVDTGKAHGHITFPESVDSVTFSTNGTNALVHTRGEVQLWKASALIDRLRDSSRR